MTQQELADAIGVCQSTASKWLSGSHLPVGLAKRELIKKYPDLYKRILKIYEERKGNNG